MDPTKVSAEQKDLAAKLAALVEFTGTADFVKLPADEQAILVQQASAMNAYNDCLLLRLVDVEVQGELTDNGRRL